MSENSSSEEDVKQDVEGAGQVVNPASAAIEEEPASHDRAEVPPPDAPPQVFSMGTTPPAQRVTKPLSKKAKRIIAAVVIVALCIVSGVYFTDRSAAMKVVNSVVQRDGKLNERSTAALAASTNMTFQETIDETNAVITARSALISEVEQQSSRFCQAPLNTEKAILIAENDQLGKDQVAELRRQLEPLVKSDNVALGDIFILSSDDCKLSWQESFDAIDKNVADRVETIRKIKLMPALSYAKVLSDYVSLLNTENDFCRTYDRYIHALFELSCQIDYYNESYFGSADDVVSAASDAKAKVKEFDSVYAVLLKKDKAFWPTATDIFQKRDLQAALAQFYKDVNVPGSGDNT